MSGPVTIPYEVEFPDPAPRLNLNMRLHWAQRAARTRDWRHATATWWRKSYGSRLRFGPSTVTVSFGVRDPGRRRDAHNWMPTVKAIIDGLVDAGVWPDDSSDWVRVNDSTFYKGDGVTIHVEPRP